MINLPLANIRLKIHSNGSSVPLKQVTPPELMFLVADHHVNAGGNPVIELIEIKDKEVPTSTAKEKKRLAMKYGVKRVNKFYPGQMPEMPLTFDEAIANGIEATVPAERLITAGDTMEG